ncbi:MULTISPECIES: DUF1697 domain-containing protein [Myroides]|uniref:DUF1697 domain-containing protein n=2 Tax=Myroides odoratimimus TaxID=76832 RepID=A0AAI8C5M0_9FLAO|nr:MULTISPECIES: DUF1697 domain-containing protein [Myroides]ALU26396.1 hypothetical protein AS202_09655 [Myroides odoratimimus]APA92449.1 hypothetical protein BK054_09520 [Myroides sp. ZB35]EHO12120.1 hypothetical protein HMPREF9712_00367 [Myroides odoratimimus CCUG 10230]MCA4805801.1 DUF1697 domain-containing protein [Myroides odoratimimus]MCO7723893.1 DUF1697 domain-containing protein [Myroides odoratimimus]
MKTYITLLRGINVSGKNIIKMNVLKQLCVDLGLHNVQTYIQSGNIIYQSVEVDSSILSKKIQDKILSTLNLTVPILTLDIDQFEEILAQHPFTKEEELAQLYLTFIDGTPQQEGINSLEEKKDTLELLHTTDNAIYLVANIGYGKTKINNTLIENKLKVTATTRNYKTCLQIKALAIK